MNKAHVRGAEERVRVSLQGNNLVTGVTLVPYQGESEFLLVTGIPLWQSGVLM